MNGETTVPTAAWIPDRAWRSWQVLLLLHLVLVLTTLLVAAYADSPTGAVAASVLALALPLSVPAVVPMVWVSPARFGLDRHHLPGAGLGRTPVPGLLVTAGLWGAAYLMVVLPVREHELVRRGSGTRYLDFARVDVTDTRTLELAEQLGGVAAVLFLAALPVVVVLGIVYDRTLARRVRELSAAPPRP